MKESARACLMKRTIECKCCRSKFSRIRDNEQFCRPICSILFRSEIIGDCWEFQGYLTKKSYGQVQTPRGTQYTHIVSYAFFVEEIPIGKQVNHTCDNPKCFKPNHLYAGTQQDNMKDMVERKRQASGDKIGKHVRGEKHPSVKLNEEKVLSIRELYSQRQLTQEKIAVLFKVSRGTIRDITTRKSWSHI